MIFWRGWGILVLLVPFAWIFLIVGIMIGIGYYDPDEARVAALIYRLGALAFALSAICLYPIVRYRARVAPGQDEFSFVPMKYWTYVLAAVAVALLAASFFNPRF
jgi:hypothetical protein